MPDFVITLTDEQVEGIRELAIKEMPDDCPKDPKGFLEWLVAHNVETRKRERLINKLSALPTKELETMLKR